MLGLRLTWMWHSAAFGTDGSRAGWQHCPCTSAKMLLLQLGRRKISPNDELQASVWPEVSLLTWLLGSGGLWSKSRVDVQICEWSGSGFPVGKK